jgi:hypothetical protein
MCATRAPAAHRPPSVATDDGTCRRAAPQPSTTGDCGRRRRSAIHT